MWMQSLIGGLMIGLASIALYGTIGRIAGISGIGFGLIWSEPQEKRWRLAFIVGLAVGGWLAVGCGYPLTSAATLSAPMNVPQVIIAGLLVGLGTRMGNGCTSGHGICGLARLSPRSLIAVLVFMATGFVMATALRPLWG